jgi:pathogenesis-related protein 1
LTAAHNQERATVNASALSWSTTVGAYAQQWADHLALENDCRLAHHPNRPYGENLYWRSTNTAETAAHVVGNWTAEKTDYDAQNHTCAQGKNCGHYTQVVWSATTKLGCGMAMCPDGGQVWVCNYDPPGNVLGQHPF